MPTASAEVLGEGAVAEEPWEPDGPVRVRVRRAEHELAVDVGQRLAHLRRAPQKVDPPDTQGTDLAGTQTGVRRDHDQAR